MNNSRKVSDPFARARASMLRSLKSRMFMLGGFIGATDTYKRTMWCAVLEIALAHSPY